MSSKGNYQPQWYIDKLEKEKQIPPIIVDAVEKEVEQYEKTPANTTAGKILRFLSRFLPFVLRSIK